MRRRRKGEGKGGEEKGGEGKRRAGERTRDTSIEALGECCCEERELVGDRGVCGDS